MCKDIYPGRCYTFSPLTNRIAADSQEETPGLLVGLAILTRPEGSVSWGGSNPIEGQRGNPLEPNLGVKSAELIRQGEGRLLMFNPHSSVCFMDNGMYSELRSEMLKFLSEDGAELEPTPGTFNALTTSHSYHELRNSKKGSTISKTRASLWMRRLSRVERL